MPETAPPPPPDKPREPLTSTEAASAADIQNYQLGQRDLYALLEITNDATPEQIKKAFRQKSNRYHPDKHSDKDPQTLKKTHEIFREIRKAYSTLKNPNDRSQYDRNRPMQPRATSSHASPQPGAPMNPFFPGFSDIMSAFTNPFGFQTPQYPFSSQSYHHEPTQTSPQPDNNLERSSLLSSLRTSTVISEIKGHLSQLAKLHHQIEETSYVDAEKTKIAINPQMILDKIIEAQRIFKKSSKSKQVTGLEPDLLAAIEAIPNIYKIRQKVTDEFKTIIEARNKINQTDVSIYELRAALFKLSKVTKTIIFGDEKHPSRFEISQVQAKIEQIGNSAHDPEKVAQLVTQLPQWLDLDLKIYHGIRESRKAMRTWQNSVIPPQIEERYLAFVKKLQQQ